jgi:hypothetical protein
LTKRGGDRKGGGASPLLTPIEIRGGRELIAERRGLGGGSMASVRHRWAD